MTITIKDKTRENALKIIEIILFLKTVMLYDIELVFEAW